jgi:hypothetical protein
VNDALLRFAAARAGAGFFATIGLCSFPLTPDVFNTAIRHAAVRTNLRLTAIARPNVVPLAAVEAEDTLPTLHNVFPIHRAALHAFPKSEVSGLREKQIRIRHLIGVFLDSSIRFGDS